MSKRIDWHWGVHSTWLIATLMAIIAWLIIQGPTASAIRDYLGFASSIAALILAVIAIFQAIIAQRSTAENSSELRASVEDIRSAASNISKTSEILATQQNEVISHVSRMPEELAKISDSINSRDVSPESAQVGGKKGDQNDATSVFRRSPLGIKFTLAVLALSKKHNKSFDVYELFSSTMLYGPWINGSIQVIRALQLWGVRISGIQSEGKMLFGVDSKGEFDVDAIIGLADTSFDDEGEKALWEKVKAYFSKDEKVDGTEDDA